MDDRAVDAGALIAEVEGHLLIEATFGDGRLAAARFARQFGWLTEGQRAVLEERFVEEYVALARASWRWTARRGVELRGEYEGVYRGLRRRVILGAALGIAGLVATVGLLSLTR
ncbi:hypothetical protein C6Y14_42285 [Streptomyces dioscori]|uniref:Uncharacterized protein n=2 Tax=Streptomyces dioscori TaxID=2109333 RepID=A0A2P8PTU4_9ACTN|nr:hypothetical protein [Streptomyces dioscori]PSM37410.1 hypothetical protein C6Y14_42285 [Streptomyces dioscori]